MSGRAASPARRAAFRVVRRVFEHGAFADQAIHTEARDLDARDRAFARALAFGTIQRRRTLDHVIAQLAPKRKLDIHARTALQLGVFQLLLMDGVATHAAVDETVALVRNSAATGFVNAILRRAATEGQEILDAIEDEATRLSYPTWLVALWREAYGEATASALMERLNEPPELALRVNTLKTTAEELAAAIDCERAEDDAVVMHGGLDAYAHPLWAEGHFMPQSRASQAVGRFTAPQPGERVLDLCAAPGGKTTHLAALMGNEGAIVSVERNGDRAEQLQQTCDRMGVTIATVDVNDAAKQRDDGPFDRVLVDPPCSGLGTLQARPDLRWRMNPDRIAGLIEEQRKILVTATRAVRPGGVVIWSTCTLDPAENEHLLEGLTVTDQRTLWPHETRSAGFQVARVEC